MPYGVWLVLWLSVWSGVGVQGAFFRSLKARLLEHLAKKLSSQSDVDCDYDVGCLSPPGAQPPLVSSQTFDREFHVEHGGYLHENSIVPVSQVQTGFVPQVQTGFLPQGQIVPVPQMQTGFLPQVQTDSLPQGSIGPLPQRGPLPLQSEVLFQDARDGSAVPGQVQLPLEAQPVPIGNDSRKSVLDDPVPALCASRPVHKVFVGRAYYLSWLDAAFRSPLTWEHGRNFCRRMCMDLVSLETREENEFVAKELAEASSQNIGSECWTSGLLCNFPGCESPSLQPPRVNGWFWSGSGARIPSKNSTDGFTDWSPVGGAGLEQTDGGERNCIAMVAGGALGRSDPLPHWHDDDCRLRKDVVCEDDPELAALREGRPASPSVR